MPTHEIALSEIAAVDLGSNSFRLQMARVQDGQLIFHDSLRDAVRLGAGLDQNNQLDAGAQRRAIDCLKRFGERLRGLPPQAVRAVATNTFRVASNAAELLEEAQTALGFPIEIIAGREEARMIFIGVSHGLPAAQHKRLVIDIGGGSTEFIIGQGFKPESMESLFMGCVSYSLRFFPDGKVTETKMCEAEIAAGTEIQCIQQQFSSTQWQEAVGSSGTARALGEILRLNGWSDGAITRDGLKQLRNQLVKAKDSKRLMLAGLSEDRAIVIPGGLAIMSAAFEVLNIERMTTVSTALREGVLYELLGRMNYHDIREATVNNFMRRYHVDHAQASRVEKLSLNLLAQVSHQLEMDTDTASNYLSWAVRLHEIGISIAHNGFHKHSAYIVENADMPGFSAKDQAALGLLVRCQRRSLNKLAQSDLQDDRCLLILILRLAILLYRNRQEGDRPNLQLMRETNEFQLKISDPWLKNNPLTAAELDSEVTYWKNINIRLAVLDTH